MRIEVVRAVPTIGVAFILALVAGSPALGGGDLDLPIAPGLDPLAIDSPGVTGPGGRPDASAPSVPQPDPPAPAPPAPEHVGLYDESVPVERESIIYVIDTSGSMSEAVPVFTGLDGRPTYGTRMDRAKVELIRSISALPESFEFNIFAYACIYRAFRPGRVTASAQNKAAAAAWVQALWASGGTGTGPAVSLALQDRANTTIALLTDGAPGCGGYGETIQGHLQMIVSNNAQQAKVHCFGIGAYGMFEQFLRDVAAATHGSYHPVQ